MHVEPTLATRPVVGDQVGVLATTVEAAVVAVADLHQVALHVLDTGGRGDGERVAHGVDAGQELPAAVGGGGAGHAGHVDDLALGEAGDLVVALTHLTLSHDLQATGEAPLDSAVVDLRDLLDRGEVLAVAQREAVEGGGLGGVDAHGALLCVGVPPV
jgi:hypothetical protein